jgi:nicotinate-nucleotide adenylyltransferase
MRLGIFGGTFNPVHLGHLRTAEEVKYKLGLDKIIFVPSGKPPLKDRDSVAASHRYAMVALAVASNRGFAVSDVEVRKKGKSYTVHTLQMLRKEFSGDELFFILGTDAFLEMPKWRQPEKIVEMTDFIIMARPGVGFDAIAESPYKIRNYESPHPRYSLVSGRSAFIVNVTQLDISSSEIRRLVAQRKSVRYLLPPAVERYIKKNKLYTGGREAFRI